MRVVDFAEWRRVPTIFIYAQIRAAIEKKERKKTHGSRRKDQLIPLLSESDAKPFNLQRRCRSLSREFRSEHTERTNEFRKLALAALPSL
jgi:hypothetical protein